MPSYNGPPPYQGGDKNVYVGDQAVAIAALKRANLEQAREVQRLKDVIKMGEELAREIGKAQEAGRIAARPLGLQSATALRDRGRLEVAPTDARIGILGQQMEKLVAATANSIIGKNQTGGVDILAMPSAIVSEVRARVREHGLASAVAAAQAKKPRVTIVCQGDYWD